MVSLGRTIRLGLFVAALGLALAAISAVLWLLLMPQKPAFDGNPPPRQSGEEYRAGGGKCEPAAIAALRTLPERQKQADLCEVEREEYRAQQEALFYARRSGELSEKALLFSYEQARSGVFQTILLLWTLAATALAAFAASEATRLAKSAQTDAETTIKISGETAAAASKSAAASQRSAAAAEASLRNVEAPYVFATVPEAIDLNLADLAKTGTASPFARVYFQNFGRTTAVVSELSVEMICAERLPEKPEYSRRISIGDVPIPPNNDGYPIPCAPDEPFQLDEMNDVLSGRKFVLFFGYVCFTDPTGTKHKVGFGFKWREDVKLFATSGGDAFNYRISEYDPD